MDEANNTVGAGQEDCWEGDDRFNQYCPNEDDVCETEFLVDWFPRGNIIAWSGQIRGRVRRVLITMYFRSTYLSNPS